MRHLDHGVGEEGVKRRLRFPGRCGRQGPQDHGDIERSDALDRTGMEGRADYAQPTFARMVILGVLVRLGDLGEIEVDRAAKGEDVGLSLGLQAGPAGTSGILAIVDAPQGVLGLLTGVSETDEGIGSEFNALALSAAAKAQNPRAPELGRLLRGRGSDHED